ncbi:hypothetical protein HaLaN_21872 [Haematococcus lacustris]|uniref:Uncharacterized protein n=1 Tax=Haematococcus lacustris TaxID=44745 RepID=A0A699ZZZ2_HAELA|nr:hypothetical protein HaLaN_21872 [Haematococcus lacustris]
MQRNAGFITMRADDWKKAYVTFARPGHLPPAPAPAAPATPQRMLATIRKYKLGPKTKFLRHRLAAVTAPAALEAPMQLEPNEQPGYEAGRLHSCWWRWRLAKQLVVQPQAANITGRGDQSSSSANQANHQQSVGMVVLVTPRKAMERHPAPPLEPSVGLWPHHKGPGLAVSWGLEPPTWPMGGAMQDDPV